VTEAVLCKSPRQLTPTSCDNAGSDHICQPLLLLQQHLQQLQTRQPQPATQHMLSAFTTAQLRDRLLLAAMWV
jgi:hypothetical protein